MRAQSLLPLSLFLGVADIGILGESFSRLSLLIVGRLLSESSNSINTSSAKRADMIILLPCVSSDRERMWIADPILQVPQLLSISSVAPLFPAEQPISAWFR
ncbi:uncharacterized protein BO97DRAFT_408707 [Aspergillus homomorphus CBS 101889]|uniref:Secreted protein n=1 Tax=Aspergillus homomorphus (strain CBS 101889) TaxID=1450537 RepID=A0A395HNE0_ASPHC|nr:hypothetical protein BO97DRAFT_408707 [Aspergillus homomorphus CBS 101889]RAL07794.1 hypothetical protein BO97DRAFT_408707 [Aspergillus homomorphus CBS 101889]